MILDQLVDAAIQEEYYTADGERVMLPLKSLVDLGLVDASAVDKLKQTLKAWNVANTGNWIIQKPSGEVSVMDDSEWRELGWRL